MRGFGRRDFAPSSSHRPVQVRGYEPAASPITAYLRSISVFPPCGALLSPMGTRRARSSRGPGALKGGLGRCAGRLQKTLGGATTSNRGISGRPNVKTVYY